jgi:hypothetical protein
MLILTPDKFFSKHYKRSETSQEVIQQEFESLKVNVTNERLLGKFRK